MENLKEMHMETLENVRSFPLLSEKEIRASGDPFCLKLLEIRIKAKKRDLSELERSLMETAQVFAQLSRENCPRKKKKKARRKHSNGENDPTRNALISLHRLHCGNSAFLQHDSRSESLLTKDLVKELKLWASDVEDLLEIYQQPEKAKSLSRDDETVKRVLEKLGPKGKFDINHEIFSLQEAMTYTMQQSNQKSADALEREFEATLPLEKLRTNEVGYTSALLDARKISSAEEANQAGRQAWATHRKWSAELYWKRAIEIDSNGTEAKYRSNLSLARIHLGRLLRSMPVGYRGLATKLLEQAVSDALAGVECNPLLERAYQRAAEAHLALGPYDHAMEACRILQRATCVLQEAGLEPTKTLTKLQAKAHRNARTWCQLGMIRPSATIRDIIHLSIQNLRRSIFRSLAIDALSEDELAAAGDDIFCAASAVMASLQLIYLRRSQWERESTTSNVRTTDFEMAIRLCAKVVPLEIVQASPSLKKLVMAYGDEAPFTLWSLDRLDRVGVEYLKPDAFDPCANDDKDDDGGHFEELIRRQSGEGGMSQSDFAKSVEIVRGKSAESFDRDMSPHYLCGPFSMSILKRLVTQTRFSRLQQEAMERIIDIMVASARTKNDNGTWAGGEFLGLAVNAATGIGKYGLEENPERSKVFLNMKGGIYAIAVEVTQSQDTHGYYQQLLAGLTSSEWFQQSSFDVYGVLFQYIFPVMDDEHLGMDRKEVWQYVATILSNVLDAYNPMIDYFCTGEWPTTCARIFSPMFFSGFGRFMMHQYHLERQLLIEDSSVTVPVTKDIITELVTKWNELDRRNRSAYRWEALPEETKEKLSQLAPISKVDYKKRQKEEKKKDCGGNDGGGTMLFGTVVKKLPECANCGKMEGLGTTLLHCPCNLVRYCDKECQQAHRQDHKTICKKALRKMARRNNA